MEIPWPVAAHEDLRRQRTCISRLLYREFGGPSGSYHRCLGTHLGLQRA